VTHSIELLLDSHSDAAIRALWQALADAGLPSQMQVKSPTNRPHVTLLAAQRISADVDDLLRGLADRLPIDCVVGAPVLFGGRHLTLARLIVPSAGLLALHEQVYRLSLPHVIGDPYAHCTPGHWTAHATLGRRFSAAEIGAALSAVTTVEGAASDLAARLVGLRRWDGDERVDHVLV
jgi:hypothetical protein